jgi:hypothetical protein
MNPRSAIDPPIGWCACVLLASLVFAGAAAAVPPTPAEIAEICGNAEDSAHCGKLIEERQLKKLPGLAERNGDDLVVTLYPSGRVVFRDTVQVAGAKSYSLWDYFDRINAAVIYVTEGDSSGFILVQRAGGRQQRLPAEPVLSPGRQRIATADFCASGCDNEVAIWRVTREGVAKELAWQPGKPWSDAVVAWKDDDTIAIDYAEGDAAARQHIERKLRASDWRVTNR